MKRVEVGRPIRLDSVIMPSVEVHPNLLKKPLSSTPSQQPKDMPLPNSFLVFIIEMIKGCEQSYEEAFKCYNLASAQGILQPKLLLEIVITLDGV